jgi:hypothetical protein
MGAHVGRDRPRDEARVAVQARKEVNLFRPAPSFPYANLQERRVSDQTDVLQGTLDLLIMRTIALEAMHGWAIAQRIQQISDELLHVQQGSLYPALHRLEH